MPLKPHPTDPEKMVYVKSKYRNPEETWDEPRTWVGLTDDEVNEIYASGDAYRIRIVRLIEAKLKEKNT
jgi:hypothetical protein